MGGAKEYVRYIRKMIMVYYGAWVSVPLVHSTLQWIDFGISLKKNDFNIQFVHFWISHKLTRSQTLKMESIKAEINITLKELKLKSKIQYRALQIDRTSNAQWREWATWSRNGVARGGNPTEDVKGLLAVFLLRYPITVPCREITRWSSSFCALPQSLLPQRV